MRIRCRFRRSVGRYHGAAQHFRDRTAVHEVSRIALARPTRIVHALAAELERRGHELDFGLGQQRLLRATDWKPSSDGQFRATINGHAVALRLYEKGVALRGDRERAMRLREEDRRNPRFGSYRTRPARFDATAIGELNLSALGYVPFSPHGPLGASPIPRCWRRAFGRARSAGALAL